MHPDLNSFKERNKKIRDITLWGILVNTCLMILKIISGLLIRSSSLIADGVHSLSDLATDFVVLVGSRLSNRPADQTHPYGHKRFETITSQIIALILLLVSFRLMWSALGSILRSEENYPGILIVFVASLSVVSKEIIFRFTRKISHETSSVALYANAWHHRSDAFSSVAVLIGGIAGLFGWGHADNVAAAIVGIMIIGIAVKIFYQGLVELTEHSADNESLQTIERILDLEKRIKGWHALRTRKLGGELFLDFHVIVEPDMTVQHSHDISLNIEESIKKEMKKPVNILIHIDPEGSID